MIAFEETFRVHRLGNGEIPIYADRRPYITLIDDGAIECYDGYDGASSLASFALLLVCSKALYR